MAFAYFDRVKETTTTTGTGTITLAGAVTGFRTFSSVYSTNDTFYYVIDGGTGEWEVGYGLLASSTTLTRTTVLASSNSGSAVNFSAGTKNVWVDSTAAGQIGSTSGLTRIGPQDAAAPETQTLAAQSVVSGTSNTAGVATVVSQSLSTGTGAAGTWVQRAGFALASAAGSTVTMTIATPAVMTLASHGFVTGTPVVFTNSGGALPTGITSGTTYYVVAIPGSTSTFNVATSVANAIAGTLVATSGSQSGTHTVTTSATVQNPAITTATWGPSGLTGSQTTPLLDLKQTWNTSGNAVGLRFNAVNVNSGASALLLDLQFSGSSKFNVDKNGALVLAGSSASINQFGNVSAASGGALLSGSGVLTFNTGVFAWSSTGAASGGLDTYISRPAAATVQQGQADAAAPVAQTLRVQSVATGTSNTAGQNWTLQGSRGTGTGAGGSIIFQTAPAGSSGTSQNAYTTALTIKSDQGVVGASYVGTLSTTVASLPSASTAGSGARAFITDATATTFLSTVAGGGANKVPVVSDGTNWLIG